MSSAEDQLWGASHESKPEEPQEGAAQKNAQWRGAPRKVRRTETSDLPNGTTVLARGHAMQRHSEKKKWKRKE